MAQHDPHVAKGAPGAEGEDSLLVVSPGRLEAFSDGVIAIAITLLSLEIKLPEEHDGLLRALLSLWPDYIGFLLSFLLVGQVWLNHHAVFHHLRRVSQAVLVWNLLLLMDIAFLPFATKVFTTCLETGRDAAVGSVFYGGAMFVGGLCFNALWRTAMSDRSSIKPGVPDEEIRAMTRRFQRGPVLYLVACGVGALNIWLAVATYAALIAYYMVDSRTGVKRLLHRS